MNDRDWDLSAVPDWIAERRLLARTDFPRRPQANRGNRSIGYTIAPHRPVRAWHLTPRRRHLQAPCRCTEHHQRLSAPGAPATRPLPPTSPTAVSCISSRPSNICPMPTSRWSRPPRRLHHEATVRKHHPLATTLAGVSTDVIKRRPRQPLGGALSATLYRDQRPITAPTGDYIAIPLHHP